jgi:hypothetical protein
MKTIITTTVLAILFVMTGCSNEESEMTENREVSTEQITYGSDMCEFSNKVIETVRYGGRLELNNGEKFNFMSVECLAGFYLKMADKSKIKSMKVVDFTHGKRLLNVTEMVFLNSRLRPSPNGLYLTAIEAADKKMVTYIYDAYPGPLMSWKEVLELVRDEWDLTGVSATYLNF